MDAARGIVGAIVIGRWSWTLLRATGAVLVDAAANPALEAEIRAAIEDGDAIITDLHVWRVGPGRYAAIVSLVAADPLSPQKYADRLRVHDEVVHVTIEPHRCEGHDLSRLAACCVLRGKIGVPWPKAGDCKRSARRTESGGYETHGRNVAA